MDFIATYQYLFLTLVLALLLLAGLFLVKSRFRRSIILSGLLSVPASLASFIFVPYYWYPTRVVNYEIGPEDILFSFSTGGIIWLMIVLIFKDITFSQKVFSLVIRYLWILIGGTIVYLILLLSGMNIMLATVLSILVLGAWILYFRKDYWLISLFGALGFFLFYSVFLKIAFTIFPEFLTQWNIDELFGYYVLGLPFEEILWAFVSGAVWPLIMAYLFDARIDIAVFSKRVRFLRKGQVEMKRL